MSFIRHIKYFLLEYDGLLLVLQTLCFALAAVGLGWGVLALLTLVVALLAGAYS